MIRSVAAVFAAFIVLNAVVMLGTFATAPLAAGATGAAALPPAYLAAILVVGALAAMLAGFVAAHIATMHRQWHAVLLALVMLVLAVVMILSPPPEAGAQPKWYLPTLAVLGPLAAVLGGWLRARREPAVAPGDAPPPA